MDELVMSANCGQTTYRVYSMRTGAYCTRQGIPPMREVYMHPVVLSPYPNCPVEQPYMSQECWLMSLDNGELEF